MDGDTPTLLEWRVIEAGGFGVKDISLDELHWECSDFYRIRGATQTDRLLAMFGALAQRGKPYGYWALLVLAWHQLRNRLRGRITVAEAYICTELVISCWRRAGIDILPGVKASRVMPDMIADSKFVERVK